MVIVPEWGLKTIDEFKTEIKHARFSFSNKIQ